jgi:glycolate oxidase FAD binding subunit
LAADAGQDAARAGLSQAGRLGPEASAACVSRLRAEAASLGGSLFVTSRTDLLPPGYDAWGEVGPALSLMKRIKERFDPKGILNPGCFVGGI